MYFLMDHETGMNSLFLFAGLINSRTDDLLNRSGIGVGYVLLSLAILDGSMAR